MGLTVIPTNIGGVSINSIISPLASLFGSTSAKNMTFPSDLGSNPAMGHAVIFQAYDYSTGIGSSLAQVGGAIESIASGAIGAGSVNGAISSIESSVTSTFNSFVDSQGGGLNAVGNVAQTVFTAANYKQMQKGPNIATISLFMPETMAINYSSNYQEVSLTQELGKPGLVASAYSDVKGRDLQGAVSTFGSTYGKALGSSIMGSVMSKITGGSAENITGVLNQSQGIFLNPQLQLLYKGIGLREFQLEFILTPKTAAEAETVRNICDSFAYFSLPGLAGAVDGKSGQFLTPPQVFNIQFQFLGQSGILGKISNAINGALNATGLGFLSSSTITNGKPSKTFTVNDSVLTNVSVDYAPNGWATYDDGNPVQTRLTLQFKETSIYTKESMKNNAVKNNYMSSNPAAQPIGVVGADSGVFNDPV